MKDKKELVAYIVILSFLIILVICNNIFWKLGKENTENNITYMVSDNIIYNIPFNEKILD